MTVVRDVDVWDYGGTVINSSDKIYGYLWDWAAEVGWRIRPMEEKILRNREGIILEGSFICMSKSLGIMSQG